MNYRLPTTLMLALLASIATGCGGSHASSSATSRMIAGADTICKGVNARRTAANKRVGAVTSQAALPKVAAVAAGLAAYERDAVGELRKLTAPASLAQDWRKILTGAEQLAENTAKLGEEAKAKNLKRVESLIHEDQKSEKELISIATTAGFKHCGRNT
jgi:hypothetical protein